MPSYKKLITDLERVISNNGSAIGEQNELLGLEIANLPEEQLGKSSLIEVYRTVRKLEEHISRNERTIDEWNKLSEELGTIDDAINHIDTNISAKKDEIEPNYVSIGEAIVDSYRSDPRLYADLAKTLDSIETIEENVSDMHRELQTLESTEKEESFFGKTIAKGKGFLKKGTLKTKSVQRNRLVRSVGETICSFEKLPDAPDDSDLGRALSPVLQIFQEIRTLRDERRNLEGDRNEVKQKLSDIENREGAKNPPKNLGNEVESLHLRVSEAARTLGEAFVAKDLKIEAPGKSIVTIEEVIARLIEQNERSGVLIQRLHAASDVDRLQSEIDASQSRRRKLEAELEKLGENIEILKKDKAARTKDRGTVPSLNDEVATLLGDKVE